MLFSANDTPCKEAHYDNVRLESEANIIKIKL